MRKYARHFQILFSRMSQNLAGFQLKTVVKFQIFYWKVRAQTGSTYEYILFLEYNLKGWPAGLHRHLKFWKFGDVLILSDLSLYSRLSRKDTLNSLTVLVKNFPLKEKPELPKINLMRRVNASSRLDLDLPPDIDYVLEF